MEVHIHCIKWCIVGWFNPENCLDKHEVRADTSLFNIALTNSELTKQMA